MNHKSLEESLPLRLPLQHHTPSAPTPEFDTRTLHLQPSIIDLHLTAGPLHHRRIASNVLRQTISLHAEDVEELGRIPIGRSGDYEVVQNLVPCPPLTALVSAEECSSSTLHLHCIHFAMAPLGELVPSRPSSMNDLPCTEDGHPKHLVVDQALLLELGIVYDTAYRRATNKPMHIEMGSSALAVLGGRCIAGEFKFQNSGF